MTEKFQYIIALSFNLKRNAEHHTCQNTTFPSLIESATPLVLAEQAHIDTKKVEAINIYLQHTQRVLNLNKANITPKAT